MLLNTFPGHAEAAAMEESLRALAMMSVNVELCGVEVRQFTPRQFQILDAEKSPFFAGGEIETEHVLQFFWVASPLFLFPTLRNAALIERRRTAVMQSLLKIDDFEECVHAIRSHIDQALLDRPAGSGTGGRAIASFTAMLVHAIASVYHWRDSVLDQNGQPVPEAGILDIPFARLFQYSRLINYERNPDVEPTNRLSDRAEREWIRSKKATAAAAAIPVPPATAGPAQHRSKKRNRKGRR